MRRNRNRPLISLLLLLPVLIPLLFIVMNDLNKWQIKYQGRERAKSSASLVQLRMHESKVQWMDKHEIFVNGRMFDITKSELNNGWYHFTGHYDDPETKLLRKQQKAQQQKDGQQTLLQVFKSLQQLYCESQEPGFLPATASLFQPYIPNDRLPAASLEVSTPPPQISHLTTL
ncbi:MAG TPA: hypothetical protein PLU11_12470 [Chitinophagaceae bacterium]|nr:hypothetical protein [Chitinophagaceae bacterium]HPH30831.1 hypothetical protein [Chitinophagaceae bacterium]HPN59989.1 hypothetical protein [Chitinophagaceae bacterium]